MVKNAFVYCFYGLGNTILKIPMLKALKSMRYNIDVASNTTSTNILRNESYVNIPKKINFNKEYEYIFMTLPNHNEGIYKRLNGKVINLTFDRGVQKKLFSKIHEVEANMRLARSIGYDGPIPELSLSLPHKKFVTNTRKFVDNNKKTIVVHNGSLRKNKNKRLPRNKMLVLICKLLQQNYQVILIGGREEKNHSNIETSGLTNVVNKLKLNETIALISHCDCMISSDSGPMHIGDALGLPVVSFFGPTMITKNCPWNNKDSVICSDTECRPCYWTKKNNACTDNKCLKDIDVENIIRKVRELIGD